MTRLEFVERMRRAAGKSVQANVEHKQYRRVFEVHAARMSSRMSHAMFGGLIALVVLPELITTHNVDTASRRTVKPMVAPVKREEPKKLDRLALQSAPLKEVPPETSSVEPVQPAPRTESASIAPDKIAPGQFVALDESTKKREEPHAAKSPFLPPLGKVHREIRAFDLTWTTRSKLRRLTVRQLPVPRDTLLRPIQQVLPVIRAAEEGPHESLIPLPPLVLIKAKDYGKPKRIAPRVAALTVESKTSDQKPAPASEATDHNAEVEQSEPVAPIEQQSATWSEQEISDARAECGRLLQRLDMEASEEAPFKQGACGAPAPVRVHSLSTPKVKIEPSVLLTCPMAAALHTWMRDKVQPAAKETFGSPVLRLFSAASYACRNRYGRADAPLSEHALVNALDLSGFVLADGRTVRVLSGWGPVARDAKTKPERVPEAKGDRNTQADMLMLGVGGGGKLSVKSVEDVAHSDADSAAKASSADTLQSTFLHRVHEGACGIFGTVLGPEANDAHRNHFHLDMKARAHKAFCE